MYKYAQILNGKAHWIFEDEMTLEEIGHRKFNLEQITLLDITNVADVQEGWDYDGINFTDPNIETLDEAKARYINAAGAEFARRRDSIRWVDGYGYDCEPGDITNFMAAYTPLLVAKSGSTHYKVWLTKTTKGVVERNYEQMLAVYNTVRESQLEAYAWYEGIKVQLQAAESIEELEQIYPLGGE